MCLNTVVNEVGMPLGPYMTRSHVTRRCTSDFCQIGPAHPYRMKKRMLLITFLVCARWGKQTYSGPAQG